ncbi:MAG: protein translocase subunit SecD [Actinomycetota bacterium]|nr:protein translocase subunit SecD [Actinomycetota bacterium]HZY65494.1 protein translocase subunit SecD [Rubrobacteraceae bacterium]
MNSTRNSLIVLGLVVVLIGVAAYLIFIRQPVSEATQLGLDLEGGVSVQLEGSQAGDEEVTREEMQRASEVIRQRVDSLGVTEPEIQLQGQDQMIVNIPGITDSDRAVELIGRTAQLGFYQVLAVEPSPSPVPQDEVEETKDEIREDLRDDSEYEPGQTKILFDETENPQGGGVFVEGYIVPEEPALTGGALTGANLGTDQAGGLQVEMQLNRQGRQQFGDLSQEIVEQAIAEGQPGNGQLAIVLDEDVVSAPTVEERLDQGTVVINNPSAGGLPQAEAEELEIVLQTGALPVEMEVLSVTSIGPTLGAESLRSGLIAALVGFGLVLGFLLFIYRALGIVADLALLIYAFLLWGLVVAIPITVTLPGIAGVVLTFGVAADANIVIFERIKEEVRRGKTPRTAVQIGYQKGFRAILDGNLTTLITAFILFALSSGSVRGFAVLLTIGVILSMFTAIVVTRALLGVVSSRGLHLSPAMMGVSKGSIATEQPRRVR